MVALTTERYFDRLLPQPGMVRVSVGDNVNHDTVVAETVITGEITVVHVAETLGVEPSQIAQSVRVSVGQQVTAGTLVASHRGLFGLVSSEVRAPCDGVVEFLSSALGTVGIRAPSRQTPVLAFVGGEVARVYPERGCQIKMVGSFVPGVFGIGKQRCGELCVRESAADCHDVPRGSVVALVASPTLAQIQALEQQGCVGIICGSVRESVLDQYCSMELGVAVTGDERCDMTIVLTEGFGELPLDARVQEVLRARAGAIASISGATQVRAGAVRPFIAVGGVTRGDSATPKGVSPITFEEEQPLRIGAQVRLLGQQRFGRRATVVGLPVQPERIVTGALVRVVEVEQLDGGRIRVPRANVEVVASH